MQVRTAARAGPTLVDIHAALPDHLTRSPDSPTWSDRLLNLNGLANTRDTMSLRQVQLFGIIGNTDALVDQLNDVQVQIRSNEARDADLRALVTRIGGIDRNIPPPNSIDLLPIGVLRTDFTLEELGRCPPQELSISASWPRANVTVPEQHARTARQHGIEPHRADQRQRGSPRSRSNATSPFESGLLAILNGQLAGLQAVSIPALRSST